MVPYIDPTCRTDIVRLLELGWRLDAIIEQLHVRQATIYGIEYYLI